MTFQSRDIIYSAHKAVFVMDKIANRTLQDNFNLTYSQFLVLVAINRNPDVSQRDIADFLDMTEAAVSRQIDIIVDKKYAQRYENKKNRREYILSLTESGKNNLQKAFKILDDKFEDVFKVIDEDEKKILASAFGKLLKVVCKDCRCY